MLKIKFQSPLAFYTKNQRFLNMNTYHSNVPFICFSIYGTVVIWRGDMAQCKYHGDMAQCISHTFRATCRNSKEKYLSNNIFRILDSSRTTFP